MDQILEVLHSRAREPERLEPLNLAEAILFFLQEPEHIKLEWSCHKLVRLWAPADFKNFVKSNDF